MRCQGVDGKHIREPIFGLDPPRFAVTNADVILPNTFSACIADRLGLRGPVSDPFKGRPLLSPSFGYICIGRQFADFDATSQAVLQKLLEIGSKPDHGIPN
jgi:hypothetical protein